MKKAVIVLSMLIANAALAGMEKGPLDMYDITKMMTDSVSVKVVPVPNVQKTCEAESRKRNFGGFGTPVEACSFWDKTFTGYSCTIIVGKKTNNDILGHEFRHCLQGNFH
jgi:hypothetical protein